MYKNILVPIAFDAEHAPEAALDVARSLCAPGARVTLLHVMTEVPAYAISYMPEGYAEELKRSVQQELDTLARTLPGAAGAVAVGAAAPEILEWAETHGADCIVIASHRPGLQDYLLGSTAARVVRHARCSVMVLR